MAKAPSAVRLYKGLSLYRVAISTKWSDRVWGKERKNNLGESAGESTVIRVREVAQELALSLLKAQKPVESEFTIRHFALKLLHRSRLQHQTGNSIQG